MSEKPYRWVIVTAGGWLGCVAVGAMFSLPVFLQPMSQDTGWSVTGISTAMTLAFLAMAVGSFGWGALSDRIGARPVVLIGSTILAASLALASRSATLLEFQLVFGILVGASTAAIFAPLMACVTGWFTTQRALAVSLVSAGMGMAPLTMAPLAAWLVTESGWRSAMMLLAAIAGAAMIPIAILIRQPPVSTAGHDAQIEADRGASLTVSSALRSSQFITLMLANFFCCATHSGPIFHTVSYALTCGIPLALAVSIYGVEGLAGMLGRIGFGFAGDQYGAQRVLVFGLLVQAFGVLAYSFVDQLSGFYVVAVVVGLVYAGTMPLYAVIIRENFPMRMMGTIIGGTAMAGSLGMSTGPVFGGLMYDQFGSYVPMYIAACGMGLTSVLMLASFRPFRVANLASA